MQKKKEHCLKKKRKKKAEKDHFKQYPPFSQKEQTSIQNSMNSVCAYCGKLRYTISFEQGKIHTPVKMNKMEL